MAEQSQARKSGSRERVVADIRRTRLGGADRITIDDPGTPPYKRYAHIMESEELGVTNLYTVDDPKAIDEAYAGRWRLVGVIDLDTGDVVNGQA